MTETEPVEQIKQRKSYFAETGTNDYIKTLIDRIGILHSKVELSPDKEKNRVYVEIHVEGHILRDGDR